MNTTNTYNGWTNKQTWNINLRCEGTFNAIAQENHYRTIEALADAFEAIVYEVEYDILDDGLAKEMCAEYLSQVNWMELAEQYSDAEVEA